MRRLLPTLMTTPVNQLALFYDDTWSFAGPVTRYPEQHLIPQHPTKLITQFRKQITTMKKIILSVALIAMFAFAAVAHAVVADLNIEGDLFEAASKTSSPANPSLTDQANGEVRYRQDASVDKRE